MNTASTENLHRSTYEPPETSKNHHEFLLEEDALIFSLQCEHLSTSSNFTLVAHPSATSEGTLYRSNCGFFRTDVPCSQYNGVRRTLMPLVVATRAKCGPNL